MRKQELERLRTGARLEDLPVLSPQQRLERHEVLLDVIDE